MGGASKGRVAKKQRPAKSSSRLSDSSALSSRSMRRGLSRLTRSSTHSASDDVNRSAIEDMFNLFRDQNGKSPKFFFPFIIIIITFLLYINVYFSRSCCLEKRIGAEGMQLLFEALDVDPLDITALIFAWKLNAKVPFEFSQTEFVNGCVSFKADSLDKLKKVIPNLKNCLTPLPDFRSFYMYAFEYNKPPENRSLPIETARQLFPILLEGRFHHLDLWMDFLQNRKLAISKDTYSLLLDFAVTIDPHMSNFDEENGAWPVLLDEFVDFAKPKVEQRMRE